LSLLNIPAAFFYCMGNRIFQRKGNQMKALSYFSLVFFTALIISTVAGYSQADSTQKEASLSAEKITQLAEDAYTYGLGPMVYYRLYSEQLIRDTKTMEVNKITHRRKLSDHKERGGQAPNHDTMYSLTWFDVGDEPLVVQIPDYKDRFYGIQLTSMFQNNFQNIGNSMAYGNRDAYHKEYTFMLATQDWQGEVPEGVELIRSPGAIIHFLQRTYVTPNDAEDLLLANTLQDKHLSVPLSAWNKGSREAVVHEPRLPNLVEDGELGFLNGLNTLLNAYPPANKAELEYIKQFKAINIGAGKDFDSSNLPPETREALLSGIEQGKKKVANLQKEGLGYILNGWAFLDERQGNYGSDYLLRGASVSLGGIVPRPQFNTYTLTFEDESSELLSGQNNYKIHFNKEEIPQATAFWSLTVYTPDFWLPGLEDKRYKLSNLSPGIVYNKDGSLDMYLQYESPAEDKEANWLPVPEDNFFAVIRFYAPKEAVVKGEYAPPFIQRVR
jgi:hypothetical protein